VTAGLEMKTLIATYALLLVPVLVCAQSNVTIEIIESTTANGLETHQDAEDNQVTSPSIYINCLSYLNPLNSTNVMTQWKVMDNLFQQNNIRMGVTMGSIGCSTSIHIEDVHRTKLILEKAIQDKLIDNDILKMKIEVQQPVAGSPPQGEPQAGE